MYPPVVTSRVACGVTSGVKTGVPSRLGSALGCPRTNRVGTWRATVFDVIEHQGARNNDESGVTPGQSSIEVRKVPRKPIGVKNNGESGAIPRQ